MGLFGRKRNDTIDFTKRADAHLHLVNKDYKFEGDVVDLRRKTSNSSKEAVDSFSGVLDMPDDSNSLNDSSSSSSGGLFGFLDSSKSAGSSVSTGHYPSGNVVSQVSEISELNLKLRNMTSRMEDSSNEVYRLMQRLELLEKKIERLEHRG